MNDKKECTKCHIIKKLDQFGRSVKSKLGRHSHCKECSNQFRRLNKEKYKETRLLYRLNNKQKIKEYDQKKREDPSFKKKKYYWDKKYRDANQLEIKKNKKEYYYKNKDKIRERIRTLYKDNSDLREKIAQQNRKNYIKNPEAAKERSKKYKNRKRLTDPIYRLNEQISKGIRRSLKIKRPGAHWENFMPFNLKQLIKRLESKFENGMNFNNYGKWHIDHIIPLSHFKFNSIDDINFKKAWSLTNLQPMWSFENQSKSNRYVGKFNKSLLRQKNN